MCRVKINQKLMNNSVSVDLIPNLAQGLLVCYILFIPSYFLAQHLTEEAFPTVF